MQAGRGKGMTRQYVADDIKTIFPNAVIVDPKGELLLQKLFEQDLLFRDLQKNKNTSGIVLGVPKSGKGFRLSRKR